jgi:hypothetical protein
MNFSLEPSAISLSAHRLGLGGRCAGTADIGLGMALENCGMV